MNFSIAGRAALSLLLAVTAVAAQAQTTVQALADRWAEAYNTRDGEALAAVYTDDARLMMHGSTTIVGRDGIGDFWTEDFQVGNPLTLLTVTQNVAGTDMILVHGDYKVIDRDDGKQLGFGRFAHLWTRAQDGEWQLERDLWNEPFDPYDSVSAAQEEDVQALAERWTTAYNTYDRDTLAAVYADDAALMMHGAPTIGGRDAIGAFWAEDFEENSPLTVLTVTHAVSGVDMILVHGNYEVVNREDGSRLGFGRFAHIWNDEGDEWRLDRDLWQQRFEPYPF